MSDPRRARLESDEVGIRRLAAESGGAVAIEAIRGRPATGYTVALRCPGVVALAGGSPRFGDLHRVEIALGARYPIDPPEARFLTPIFNPHVFSHGKVCLGRTVMTERLEDLVVRIGRLIQYDPELIYPKSPANADALDFARASWASLPFGRETFRRARPAAGPRLTWNDRRPA